MIDLISFLILKFGISHTLKKIDDKFETNDSNYVILKKY